MSETIAILTTSRREVSSKFFFVVEGKVPKETYVILTETLACLLPGRAKDLSTPLFSTLPNHSCASGPPVEHDNMDNQALAPRYL